MAVHPLLTSNIKAHQASPVGRATTFSSMIVAGVCAALFEKRLRPGEFLGTEAGLAELWQVSRIVARDALRTLEGLGIVDIRAGAGGGAKIAQGDPHRFAQALALQLALVGVGVDEILDAQLAIEGLAAELAARRATADDVACLRGLCDQAAPLVDQPDRFTPVSRDFHLAVAEASGNRVLVLQLVSLQHAAWPHRNRTLTADVAEHVLGTHRRLVSLIELGASDEARRLMESHIRMIRDRRVAKQGNAGTVPPGCC